VPRPWAESLRLNDIVGETGLTILEAIIAGQRDPKQLAALCGSRIKASRETVAKSLHGNWDEAPLFALKVALETYRFSQIKIQDCDSCIQHHLAQFQSRAGVINSPQNLKIQLHRVCGVDLTKIPDTGPARPKAPPRYEARSANTKESPPVQTAT
jgi:transposase